MTTDARRTHARDVVTFQLTDCQSAQDFVNRVRDRTRKGPLELVEPFVARECVDAVVLGGSIPLGIATDVSDIDLLVLVKSEGVLTTPPQSNTSVFFAGTFGQSSELAAATAVVRVEGLEFDLQFIPTRRLIELLHAARASRVTFSLLQRQLISRLRTGWLLEPDEWPVPSDVLRDDSFDIHCALHSMITAYRSVVDAKVALQDHPLLALMMGRHSVEKAFEAYFASQGFSALGLKWLRFLRRHVDTLPENQVGAMPAALAARGENLLLPDRDFTLAAGYVTAVEQFVGEVRAVLETRVKYRVAFQLSRHMAEPRVRSAGGTA